MMMMMRMMMMMMMMMSGVVENGDFRFFPSLYLPNLHI